MIDIDKALGEARQLIDGGDFSNAVAALFFPNLDASLKVLSASSRAIGPPIPFS